MIPGLLLIVGVYGLSMIVVHIAHYRFQLHPHQNKSVHYVLIPHHHLQIEWQIRYLLFSSWLQGQLIQITVIDNHIDAETRNIIQRLSQQCHIEIQSMQDAEDIGVFLSQFPSGRVVVIDFKESDPDVTLHIP